jgi:hypothetical protein
MTITSLERISKEKIAFELYGECLGTAGCREKTKATLMRELEITEQEAEELTAYAFKEWVEAYTG